VRDGAIIVAALALAAAGLCEPASSEERSVRPRPLVPFLALSADPRVCGTILAQAQHALGQHNYLDDVPYEDTHKGLRLPVWTPLYPEQHLELLSRMLPRIGWETRQVEKRIHDEEMPNAAWEDVQKEFWRRHGA